MTRSNGCSTARVCGNDARAFGCLCAVRRRVMRQRAERAPPAGTRAHPFRCTAQARLDVGDDRIHEGFGARWIQTVQQRGERARAQLDVHPVGDRRNRSVFVIVAMSMSPNPTAATSLRSSAASRANAHSASAAKHRLRSVGRAPPRARAPRVSARWPSTRSALGGRARRVHVASGGAQRPDRERTGARAGRDDIEAAFVVWEIECACLAPGDRRASRRVDPTRDVEHRGVHVDCRHMPARADLLRRRPGDNACAARHIQHPLTRP